MISAATKPGHMGVLAKAALVVSGTFVAVGLFSIGPVLPRLGAAFADTPQAWLVLWVGGIAPPAFALASPLAGKLVVRLGYRLVYLVSIMIFLFAGVLPAVVNDLWVIVSLRLLLGVAVAGALTAALDGIGRLPEAERASLFGLQALVGSLSAVAAYPAAGLLAKVGWHLPFTVNLFGVLVLPLVLALPRPVSPTAAVHGEGAAAGQGWLAGLSPVLCLFAAIVGVVMFSMQMVAGFYLVSIGIADPAQVAIPLTAMAIASMLAAVTFGFVHRLLGTTATFAAVTTMIGIGLLICATATALTVFTGGAVLMGAGLSICSANLYTAVSASRAGAAGPALGVINAAIYLAPVALPLTMGPIAAWMGAGGIFLVFALLMFAAASVFATRLLNARLRRAAVADGPAV